MYSVEWTNRAEKEAYICLRAGCGKQFAEILKTVKKDPYDPSQQFERLSGNLNGFCSRRINHRNRFLYTVLPNNEGARDAAGKLYDGIVLIHESWGHEYKKPKKKPRR
jgi:Txe/YoeB family toxin of toxin-antitoxin system